MERVRHPAVAGSFYPAEPEELENLIKDSLLFHPLGPRGEALSFPSLFGGMVPHAGYLYSGPCAAHFYSALERDTACVILLGVNHRGRGSKAALSPARVWETPLGEVEVDQDLMELIKTQVSFLREDERAHNEEHSLEVQLPFLQRVLGGFSFLPVSLSHLSVDECRKLGEAVARIYEANRSAGKKTVLIASSDLSHYLSPEETEKLDRMVLEQVLALDPEGLLRIVEERQISMCGVFPTAVFLFAARALAAKRARLLKHCHSGDAMPMRQVVGYASVAVEI